jgi:hypothetical protein
VSATRRRGLGDLGQAALELALDLAGHVRLGLEAERPLPLEARLAQRPARQ